jgi:hypothetical protein
VGADRHDFSQAKRGAVIPEIGKTRITIYLGRIAIAFSKLFRKYSKLPYSFYC